ncbi:hypothetical protein CPC08DRAFT_706641 [Agrocybe pediades]|nr:hypothetical protein CPC08DRAFT_706641 [Agrocybe pediades]
MPQLPFSYGSVGIHSMPVEILTLIFLAGAASEDPYAGSAFLLKPDKAYNPLPSSNFQVVVSHVCRHWRQTAIATQSLWTILHFRHPSHIKRGRIYLARSCSSPTRLLDILIETVSFEEHDDGRTLYDKELNQIFLTIIPQIRRWRTFHLKISDNKCKGTARLYLGTCGPAPFLETLQLYHFENYRTVEGLFQATYRPPVAIFGNSLPRLKNLSLIGVNLQWEKIQYLHGLHHLELALHSENVRISYKIWDRMLRSCPELKTLSLHYSGPKKEIDEPPYAWHVPENRIRLENLASLNLTDLGVEYLCTLINGMCFPALRKLSIELPDQDYSPFIELITRLPASTVQEFNGRRDSTSKLEKVNPIIPFMSKLEILEIRMLNCSLQSWTGLLQAVHGLRQLEVDFARVPDLFWTVFTQGYTCIPPAHRPAIEDEESMDSHKVLLLPKLEIFKFTAVSGEDITSALRYRHSCQGAYKPASQEWIVGWSDRRRERDQELDDLINRGYWIPDGINRASSKVIINGYYDDDDEDTEDEGDEDEDS